MNYRIDTLMRQSVSAARKYGDFEQLLTQLIDRRQRTESNDTSRELLERQIQAVTSEMRALCGGDLG
jgi:hypothetical protein